MASITFELDSSVTLKDAEELMDGLNETMNDKGFKWMIREIVVKGD
jgi:hypothetical protein